MAFTLVVNPGSTSRKYAFYRDAVEVASIQIEKTETDVQSCITEINGVATCEMWPNDSLETALPRALAWAEKAGFIANTASIARIAVRIVAPGIFFTEHRIINHEYIEKLREAAYLVPVHIPIVLAELEVVAELFPQTPCVAVSDSAFHVTQLPHVSLVSLPNTNIRRYGYHGLSAASIMHRLPVVFTNVPSRTIVLHVGGGVSVIALKDGVSIAASMGFTPSSGMMMGTRGGDVGADALVAYMREHDLTPTDALMCLYKQSGFKATAHVSDLRLLLERAATHDEEAALVVQAFVYQVQSWIAAQAVLMGGIDAVVLTATASVRNPALRAKLLNGLALLNIVVDQDINDALIGKEGRIEAAGSVPIIVLKTDEMGEMVRAAETVVVT